MVAAYLCISDKLGDIQSIVRKTRDRISVHYSSPEWRLLDRIAKFASTIPTTGERYANSMGRRLTFCAISALKENLHAPFPFLMRLCAMARPKVISGIGQKILLLAEHVINMSVSIAHKSLCY